MKKKKQLVAPEFITYHIPAKYQSWTLIPGAGLVSFCSEKKERVQ
jgi:hypothetical protein